jgi:hypothetical protein
MLVFLKERESAHESRAQKMFVQIKKVCASQKMFAQTKKLRASQKIIAQTKKGLRFMKCLHIKKNVHSETCCASTVGQ